MSVSAQPLLNVICAAWRLSHLLIATPTVRPFNNSRPPRCEHSVRCPLLRRNIKFSQLPTRANWYRPTNISMVAIQCEVPGACVGGRNAGQGLCAEGQEGVQCAACKDNWFRQGLRQKCIRCPGGGAEWIIIIFAGACIAGLVALLSVLRCAQLLRNGSGQGRRGRLLRLSDALGRRGSSLGIKLKILVSLSQLVRGVGFVFRVEFPPMFEAVSRWLGSIMQVDLPNLLPLDCVRKLSFFDLLLLRTALPLVLCAGLVGASLALRGRARTTPAHSTASTGSPQSLLSFLSSAASTGAFLTMYLVFPMASVAVIQFFVCDELDMGGGATDRVLRADATINCDGEAYDAWRLYALSMVIVYPVGIPSYFALLLLRHRHLIRSEGSRHPGKQPVEQESQMPPSVARITKGYTTQCYWFELFESARKLAVVGLPCIFPTGSYEQLFFGVLTCFATCSVILFLR